MPKLIDLTGRKFGGWTVLNRASSAKRQTRWKCRCACGKIRLCSGGNLRGGLSLQCKVCSNRAKAAKATRHGMSNTRLYYAWFGMIQRCENPANKSYAYYGRRGITVCERWHRFEDFYADMGDRPPGYTLDRKDNDGPYCKENCRWVSRKTQMRNTRTNRFVTFNGQRRTVAEWAEVQGGNSRTLWDGLKRHGWDMAAYLAAKRRK